MREFVALCHRHPYPGVQEQPYDRCRAFLERCCEIGLLERRDHSVTGTRYYPTAALHDWADLIEDLR